MTVPSADELLFLALGGAGEIGMNLNLYGHAGKWLMLDLGIAFGSFREISGKRRRALGNEPGVRSIDQNGAALWIERL